MGSVQLGKFLFSLRSLVRPELAPTAQAGDFEGLLKVFDRVSPGTSAASGSSVLRCLSRRLLSHNPMRVAQIRFASEFFYKIRPEES